MTPDHPHAWRFGDLCAEDNPDVAQRDAYRGLVARLASGEPEPVVPASTPRKASGRQFPADPWLVLIRACEDHNPGCCSHPAAFCTRFNRDTTREQCVECLTAQGKSPC